MANESYAGGEAKLYYNSATYASPTWVEITNCEDLDFTDSRTKIAANIRANWPFNTYLAGARDISITWRALAKKGTTDTALTAIIAAYDAATDMEFAIADAPIATSATKYKRQICKVVKAEESQPRDGAVMYSFEAAPSINNSGNLPTRVAVP